MAAALALLSSLMWGSSDFLGGLAARRLPPAAVVGWSQGVALLAVATIEVGRGGPPAANGWLGWAVLAGAAGALGLVSFYTALATGTMGVVSPIAALGVFVPVTAGLLSGEVLGRLQAVGMVLGLIGVVAAGGPELTGGVRGRSVLLAALAGLCFGTALLAMQHGARADVLATMLGMRATSVALFGTAALVGRTVGGVRRRNLPVLAAVGLVDVTANVLFALASTRGLASVVAVLGALYPVVTVLLGALVLKERLAAVQQAGVACALGGVLLLAGAGA